MFIIKDRKSELRIVTQQNKLSYIKSASGYQHARNRNCSDEFFLNLLENELLTTKITRNTLT